MRKVSDKSCRRHQSTHFVFNNVFRRLYLLRDSVEKYCRRGRQQMTILLLQIAWWITKATHTLTICNVYYFSTAKMLVRTRLDVTLYVNSLSSLVSPSLSFFLSFFLFSFFLSFFLFYFDLFCLLIVGVEGYCCTERLTSMVPAEFEPAIPAGERPKSYNLDRAATGTGFS